MDELLKRIESVEQRLSTLHEQWVRIKQERDHLSQENQDLSTALISLKKKLKEIRQEEEGKVHEVFEELKWMRNELLDCLDEVDHCIQGMKKES